MRLLTAVVVLAAAAPAFAQGTETKREPQKPAAAERQGLAIGDAAPLRDVKMEGTDGKSYALDDLKGEKGTLVIFSCNHCPYAVKWADRIGEIGKEWQAKGFGVVVVNSNDPEKNATDGMDGMKQFAADHGYEFPYVVDATSDMARKFGATKTPEVFLFDASLKLAYHGAVDDSAESADKVEKHFLRDALADVAAGKAVAAAESKAIGCSIKFRPAKPAEEARKGGT